MSNSWFRMYAEFSTDPKVQMLSEAYQRRLLMLFCNRCNGDVTLHDDEVAFQLRITAQEWSETKAQFIAKGFIDSSNKVLNWDKRQYRSDSSAERVRTHRGSKKRGDVTECNVTVTPPDTEQIQNRTEQIDSLRSSTGAQAPDDDVQIFKSGSQRLIEAHTPHPRREEIRQAIIRRLPKLRNQNAGEIDRWIEAGADPDIDIMPCVEGIIDRKGAAIGSYSYFTPEITSMVEVRAEQSRVYAAAEAKYANQI